MWIEHWVWNTPGMLSHEFFKLPTVGKFVSICRRRRPCTFRIIKPDETVQACMEKMLASDIRHLPLVESGELLGMVSIKDLVKTTIKEKEETIKVLSDFALGKGGHFGSD